MRTKTAKWTKGVRTCSRHTKGNSDYVQLILPIVYTLVLNRNESVGGYEQTKPKQNKNQPNNKTFTPAEKN